MKRGGAGGLLMTMVVMLSSLAALSAPRAAEASFASKLVILRSSASPPPPAHSVALGRVSPEQSVHVDITLKVPDPGALTSFVASLSDRGSPNFHHFLHPGQFGRIFGPPLSEVARIEALLRSDGLQPGRPSSSRLLIPVTAPAAKIERAFHVSLVRYRLPTGRVAFTSLSAPSISASVASDVGGVVGLSELIQPHDMLAHGAAARQAVPRAPGQVRAHPRTTGPTPCSPATQSTAGSYTADQLAAYYGMTPLYAMGDFGQGIHIAVAEFEPNLASDIAAYQACYGTSATVNYVPVDGGVSPGAGTDSEAAMDIEDVIGLAPRATIDVYQAPSPSNAYVLDLYSAIVSPPPGVQPDPVVSTSWGQCELDQDASDSSYRSSEWNIFEQAATQGQTVLAAAGDAGAADCYGDTSSPNQHVRSVDDPASQPNVVGVGGTSLGSGSETVWNDAAGSGGGGVSSTWCMPTSQSQPRIQGLISAGSQPAGAGSGCAPGNYLRQVPDVSADADPETGYVIFWKGSWTGVYGGTSAAAPLWAAAAALIDSSPFCADYGSGNPGVLPAGLYSIAALGSPYYGLAFNDVTAGDNTFQGVPGFSATAGYDLASGLGSPLLGYFDNYRPGLAAQMCLEYRTNSDLTQITGVTPDAGPSGQAVQVTITGSGFLPIPGADRLQVGSGYVTAECPTTTSCAATLPPGAGGTVDLVMTVEDTTVSPIVAADRFTYSVAPTVTKLTPAIGPAKGGTRVTIWGGSFVGAVSVRFGDKPATSVRVISSSELSVAVPPGAGAAYVTVSTAIGSSPVGSTSLYTFLAAPTVTRISPAIGPKKGGTRVTILGSHFVGDVSVHFGGKAGSHLRVISSTKLSVDVPSGAGTSYVTVSTPGGSSRTNATTTYRFLAAPTLAMLSPHTGPELGGNKVTIRGSNFAGAVSVRFGDKPASHVKLRSSSEITVVAPPGSGTVPVVVSTVGGLSQRVPTGSYRY